MTISKKTTVKTSSARKVRARKTPVKKTTVKNAVAKTLAGLTEAEMKESARKQADAFIKADEKNKRTMYAHMGKGMKAVGYGREITGANMGALTCAVFAELGYITVSASGNVTATKKEIDRSNITALLGGSMSNRWYNTHTRIVAGKLNAKGLNMLNARNAGEAISKSGEGTTSCTKIELIKYYRTWLKTGKGSKQVPFFPSKVTVSK